MPRKRAFEERHEFCDIFQPEEFELVLQIRHFGIDGCT